MTMGAIPAGAVENGREFLRRIAQNYEFECEGGKLANCFEYTEAVRCFEHLAAYVSSLPSPPVSGEVVEALRAIDQYEVVAETSKVNQLFRLKNIARSALAQLDRRDIIGFRSADATLIAAAPELAEALAQCISYRNWEIAEGGVVPDDLRDTWRKAEAALSKARGEA